MLPSIFTPAGWSNRYKLPFSGDVTQAINPWTWMLRNPTWGLINVVVGKTGNPETEQAILEEVGSYGRQIGRLADAVDVLLSTIDIRTLTQEQAAAVVAFKDQLRAVRSVKAAETGRDYPDLSKPPPGAG